MALIALFRPLGALWVVLGIAAGLTALVAIALGEGEIAPAFSLPSAAAVINNVLVLSLVMLQRVVSLTNLNRIGILRHLMQVRLVVLAVCGQLMQSHKGYKVQVPIAARVLVPVLLTETQANSVSNKERTGVKTRVLM